MGHASCRDWDYTVVGKWGNNLRMAKPKIVSASLAKADVAWVTVSNMPLAQIEAYKARMGWAGRSTPPTDSRAAAPAIPAGARCPNC
jgi:hypothetical protein